MEWGSKKIVVERVNNGVVDQGNSLKVVKQGRLSIPAHTLLLQIELDPKNEKWIFLKRINISANQMMAINIVLGI